MSVCGCFGIAIGIEIGIQIFIGTSKQYFCHLHLHHAIHLSVWLMPCFFIFLNVNVLFVFVSKRVNNMIEEKNDSTNLIRAIWQIRSYLK